MKFRLEEWLKNYKPRVVGTNMVTKKTNTAALRVSGNRNLGHCVPITDPDTGKTYPTRKAFCEANGIAISDFDYSMRICNGDLTAETEKTPAVTRGPSGCQSGNRQKLQHLGGDRGGLRDPGINDLSAESPREATE